MTLLHISTDSKNNYHHFSTDRAATVQIGKSTNPGLFIWSIYHPDIRCAIWGGEADSLESAKAQADQWVLQWVVPLKS